MGNLSDKFLKWLRLEPDMDDDYDDDYEEEVVKKEKPKKEVRNVEPSNAYQSKPKMSVKTGSKVVPMRSNKYGMEVCVIKPLSMDDAQEITDVLLSGRAVVLNLEGIHLEVAQRIIDFTIGSCYAMRGNLQKISSSIFIVTPESVDISGDIQDAINGNLDVSTFSNPF